MADGNGICNPLDALLRDNFATQTVNPANFDVVVDLDMKDPITDMPMVYIGDFDIYEENNGSGAVQSIAPGQLENAQNIMYVGDLINGINISNERVAKNLPAIQKDLLGAADRYVCATEDHSFKELTTGWKEELGINPFPKTEDSSERTLIPGFGSGSSENY